MERALGVADPTTVLTTINTGHLQVASVPTSSEPTTPSSESPLTGSSLREWLTEVVANSTNPKVYSKLLVSNAAAGSVIGKAGGNINDVQVMTFAHIQLSKAEEYFPGTTERTLLVTGRLKQVVAALGLIFAKLQREGVAPLSPRSKVVAAFPRPPGIGEEDCSAVVPSPPHLLARLLVPQPLCGVIIGKHGSTIRNYAANTNTVIRVTSSEASQVPTSHRIVTIAGERQGVLKAIALVVLKQSEDPMFPLYGELPSPAMLGMTPRGGYRAGSMTPAFPDHHAPLHLLSGAMPAGSMAGRLGAGSAAMLCGMGGGIPVFGLHPGMSGSNGGPDASLSLILTEDQSGMLLEQGSQLVMEVEQMTGCRVWLDGSLGSFGRLLLMGSPDGITYAQWLLGQRLAAAASFQMGGTTYYSAPTPGFVTAVQPRPGLAFSPWQQQQLVMAAATGMMLPLHDNLPGTASWGHGLSAVP